MELNETEKYVDSKSQTWQIADGTGDESSEMYRSYEVSRQVLGTI